jgi:hypothetical protein
MWEPPPRPRNAVFESQPPFVPPPLQQQPWVPDQVWQPPPGRRNNALFDSQPPFVPPPLTPQGVEVELQGVAAEARAEEIQVRVDDIESRFQEASRLAADLTSLIDQLRKASTGQRVVGPGHNQGPSLEDLDDVEDLISLLKDDGPRVKTAIDAKALIEKTEKVKRLPERIWSLLKAAGLIVLTVGAQQVTKDLTAPLWDDVAHRIADLCHAIDAWISLLPPI